MSLRAVTTFMACNCGDLLIWDCLLIRLSCTWVSSFDVEALGLVVPVAPMIVDEGGCNKILWYTACGISELPEDLVRSRGRKSVVCVQVNYLIPYGVPYPASLYLAALYVLLPSPRVLAAVTSLGCFLPISVNIRYLCILLSL